MKRWNYFDISIYQIQLFLEVAREKNFSKVSEQMNITQPALSKKISALEATVGFHLFERSKRPVALTPVGEYLASQWTGLLECFEASVAKAGDMQKDAAKSLRVGCVDSLDMKYSRLIREFFEQHPGVACYIEFCQFYEMEKKLLEGSIDLVLWPESSGECWGQDIESRKIALSPIVVCMLKSNPLAQKEKLKLCDLINQRFILISPGEKSDSYTHVAQICSRAGFAPRIARYVPNAHALILALRGKDEVVLCDRFLTGTDNPEIKCFELDGLYSSMDIIWKRENNNPSIALFIEYFVKRV